jgi:hypothetical protein
VLKSLTTLDLGQTKVTDSGVRELHVLKALTALDLGHTKVTAGGLKDLREALPGCKIQP